MYMILYVYIVKHYMINCIYVNMSLKVMLTVKSVVIGTLKFNLLFVTSSAEVGCRWKISLLSKFVIAFRTEIKILADISTCAFMRYPEVDSL